MHTAIQTPVRLFDLYRDRSRKRISAMSLIDQYIEVNRSLEHLNNPRHTPPVERHDWTFTTMNANTRHWENRHQESLDYTDMMSTYLIKVHDLESLGYSRFGTIAVDAHGMILAVVGLEFDFKDQPLAVLWHPVEAGVVIATTHTTMKTHNVLYNAFTESVVSEGLNWNDFATVHNVRISAVEEAQCFITDNPQPRHEMLYF